MRIDCLPNVPIRQRQYAIDLYDHLPFALLYDFGKVVEKGVFYDVFHFFIAKSCSLFTFFAYKVSSLRRKLLTLNDEFMLIFYTVFLKLWSFFINQAVKIRFFCILILKIKKNR